MSKSTSWSHVYSSWIKCLAVGLLATLPLVGHSGTYACGKLGIKNEEQRKAIDFLATVSGSYQHGKCHIELNLCDPNLEPERGSIVGDLLITDKRGEKFYLPLDFYEVGTEKVKHVLLNGDRMFHYEYIERLEDSTYGRTEAYRLEFVKTEDLSRLELIELGVYTSKLREAYPQIPRNRSYWVICD